MYAVIASGKSDCSSGRHFLLQRRSVNALDCIQLSVRHNLLTRHCSQFQNRWVIYRLNYLIFMINVNKYRTGIMNPELPEQVILDPRLIARTYMRSWFFLDLISSIPLDYIFLIFNQDFGDNFQILHAGRALRILRFAKMLSLLRLLRLSRLVRYVSQWEEVYVSIHWFNLYNLGIKITNIASLQ